MQTAFKLLTPMFILGVISIANGGPNDPSFIGTFESKQISIELAAEGPNYAGTIHMADNKLPVLAHVESGKLLGTFQSHGHDFPFSAVLSGGSLTFTTANTDYVMERKDVVPPTAAVNPLNPPAGSPAGSSPAAIPTAAVPAATGAPTSASGLPAGFSELGVTRSGRSLFAKLTEAATVDAVIQQTGDALGKIFDAKPRFTEAVVDSKNQGKGVASFTGKLKGQEIKGTVVFGVNPEGSSTATILYAQPDAPKEEMDVLMATLPARARTQTVHFPDNSGSIELPEGWSAKMQSLTSGAWFIAGPNRQVILCNNKIVVDTPESFRVKIAAQAYDSSMRLWDQIGRRGPVPLSLEQRLSNLTISPVLSPEDAFTNLLPQISEKAKNGGRPWAERGNVTATRKMDPNPQITGAQSELFACESTLHIGGTAKDPLREVLLLETFPGGDSWAVVLSEYMAPPATFARDLPTMMGIVNSARLNDGAVQRQLDKDNAAFQAMSAQFASDHEALLQRGRDFNANQDERFRRNQELVQAQAQARHDANSDTQEMALGLRDVYDSATGETRRVDLYNSTGIVNGLNALANDPNRFIQVPFRYER